MAVGHKPTCVSTLTLAAEGLSSQVFHAPFGAPNLFLFKVCFFFLYGLFTPLITPKGKNRINKALSK